VREQGLPILICLASSPRLRTELSKARLNMLVGVLAGFVAVCGPVALGVLIFLFIISFLRRGNHPRIKE